VGDAAAAKGAGLVVNHLVMEEEKVAVVEGSVVGVAEMVLVDLTVEEGKVGLVEGSVDGVVERALVELVKVQEEA
jgi:hypothetical protein